MIQDLVWVLCASIADWAQQNPIFFPPFLNHI